MKLSIIVITYNQQNTISRTIDSILSQEHEYDYEVIIGDDGSIDLTPSIIEDYSNTRPGIIKPVLRKKNIGLVRNYYDLIHKATGELIMVCAGDDYWLPGKIIEQVSFMETHPNIGMTYSDAIRYNVSSNIFDGKLIGSNDNSIESFLRCNHVPAVTMCFRHELINKYISEINPLGKEWLMEDYPIVLWMAINSKIHYLQKTLCVYCEFDTSESHSIDYYKRLKFEENVLQIKKFFVRKTTLTVLRRKINNQIIINKLQTSAYHNCEKDHFSIYKSFHFTSIREITKFFLLKHFPSFTMKFLSNRATKKSI